MERYECMYFTMEEAATVSGNYCTNETRWGEHKHLLASGDCVDCTSGINKEEKNPELGIKIGTLVRHPVFGEGVISNTDEKYLTVVFEAESKTSEFLFPQCFFEDGYLRPLAEEDKCRLQLYLASKYLCSRCNKHSAQIFKRGMWNFCEKCNAEIRNCTHCGEPAFPGGRKTGYGVMTCASCFEKHWFRCGNCRATRRIEEMVINGAAIGEKRWCTRCIEKVEFDECSQCGVYFPICELEVVDGNLLCQTCKSEYSFKCEDCGKQVYTDSDPEEELCEVCLNKRNYIRQWEGLIADGLKVKTILHRDLARMQIDEIIPFFENLVMDGGADIYCVEQHKVKYLFVANRSKFPISCVPVYYGRKKIAHLAQGVLAYFTPTLRKNKVVKEIPWGSNEAVVLWECFQAFEMPDESKMSWVYLVGTLEPKEENQRVTIDTEDIPSTEAPLPIYVCDKVPVEHDQHAIRIGTFEVKTGDGEAIRINANVCIECDYRFILYSALRVYQKKYGVLLYPFVPSSEYRGGGFEGLNKYSKLALMGYSVSQANGLSRRARRELLTTVLDNEWMCSYEVIDHLERLQSLGGANPKMANAIEEWGIDAQFVGEYRLNKFAEAKGYLTKK